MGLDLILAPVPTRQSLVRRVKSSQVKSSQVIESSQVKSSQVIDSQLSSGAHSIGFRMIVCCLCYYVQTGVT